MMVTDSVICILGQEGPQTAQTKHGRNFRQVSKDPEQAQTHTMDCSWSQGLKMFPDRTGSDMEALGAGLTQ